MQQVQYVGPLGAVSIQIGQTLVTVATGEVVSVPPDVAGTPPSEAFMAAYSELVAAANAIPRDHNREAAARAALIDVMEQSGSGLLAQPDNWAPPAPSKKDGK